VIFIVGFLQAGAVHRLLWCRCPHQDKLEKM